jgi:hypothetical protein
MERKNKKELIEIAKSLGMVEDGSVKSKFDLIYYIKNNQPIIATTDTLGFIKTLKKGNLLEVLVDGKAWTPMVFIGLVEKSRAGISILCDSIFSFEDHYIFPIKDIKVAPIRERYKSTEKIAIEHYNKF